METKQLNGKAIYSPKGKARCLIRMSIRANNKGVTKDSRFAGFEWRDHLTIR